MILIFLFLMAHNIEHLFVCLFVIRMSLVKCQFFCPFFKLDFFNVEFREFFMYSKYNLLDTWFTNIYLIFSFNSSFHFLKRILLRKKTVFNFVKVQFINVSFYGLCFGVMSKYLLSPRIWRLFSKIFFYELYSFLYFVFLHFIYKPFIYFKLILVQSMRYRLRFINFGFVLFIPRHIQFSQYHLWKGHLPPLKFFFIFVKNYLFTYV